MKKLKTIFIIIIALFCTLACDTNNTEGLNILTTIYPITYVLEEIYPEGNISSIYPSGANINDYSLTAKQIKEYSKNNVFIYNGLTNELTIAKNLINENSKLKIIDVTYGLKNENGLEELWLSPNYYLMLATTIKNNLKEFTNNKYVNENIETKFAKLEENLSMFDAELRNVAKSAKDLNKSTIIVSSNAFKYLNSYGFNIISLADEGNLTNINLNNIKNNFKNGNYTYILMKDNDTKTDLINDLEKNYNAKIISVNTLTTLSEENIKNQEDYATIMRDYLENIKNITLGE